MRLTIYIVSAVGMALAADTVVQEATPELGKFIEQAGPRITDMSSVIPAAKLADEIVD